MNTQKKYILGLDLGVASQGTAIAWENGELKLLAHCFDTVTGSIKEIEEGKEKSETSNNGVRRQNRLRRRQYKRKARRTAKLFHQLQKAALLPEGESRTPRQRQLIIEKLDKTLLDGFLKQTDCAEDRRRIANLLPYLLRAKALEAELSPYEFGRTLYHLGQRRGFLSNRKERAKDIDESGESKDEEKGKVSVGIRSLNELIKQAGCKTMGQYFSTLDSEKQRIRVGLTPQKTYPHYASRQMYIDEFNAIWKAQLELNETKPHPILSLLFRREVFHTIFYQRPLKSQKDKIGFCELERGKRRASQACLEFQRFRYWQRLNDIRILLPNNEERPFTEKEKNELASLLEKGEIHKYVDIATHFGWKKAKNEKYIFNHQAMGEKSMLINVTAKRIRQVYPEWDNMPGEKQEALVDILMQGSSHEKTAKCLQQKFDLSSNVANELAGVTLVSDYASYSRKALRKLLPELQKGQSLRQVLDKLYPDRDKKREKYSLLPPVEKVLPHLTNPSVKRSLTELRKVVNAVIREYGLPETIRVELSRNLKKGKKAREKTHERMLENRSAREKAEKSLLKEVGLNAPSSTDILKYRLWQECGGKCPYSNDPISLLDLFGPHPQFDIEHIFPRQQSLDNSFANKTLCRKDYNLRKGDNLPLNAPFTEDERHSIIENVKRFKGPYAKEKLERFKSTKIPSDFINRMLNDNSFIATEAVKYLACLYGGIVDQDGSLRDTNERDPDDKRRGKLRIQVIPGQATARLRRIWGLNAILGPNRPEDEKYRADHRHHAIDALVIAHSTPAIIRKLAEESELADKERLRDNKHHVSVPEPQDNFISVVRDAVEKINVSFRANRKVSGGFHKDTNFSPSQYVVEGEGKKAKRVEYRHVREPIAKMSKGDIEKIVDPTVRELVLQKLNALGGDPKAFSNENELPYMRSKDGSRLVPIRKARYRKSVSVLSLGKSEKTQRHVAPGNNHHMEIVAVLDKDGNETKWEGVIVSMYEAYQRRRRKEPVICRDHGPDKLFKFSLALKEYFTMPDENGKEQLYIVRVLSQDRNGAKSVSSKLHNDARPSTEILKTKGLIHNANTLMEKVIQKVFVDVLGEIHPAND